MAAQRLSRRQKHILHWLAADPQRTRGMITSSHQDLVRALPGDKGNMSHSLQTLEARGLIVIGRSPGGNAEFLWLTPEGQKGAAQLAGSCDEGETDVAPMGYRACNSLYGAPAPLSAGGSSKMASKVRNRVRNVRPKLAALRRGGRLPQASVSPARMRATRDLLRRRRPLAHKRAERLAHVQHTPSPSPLPAMGTQSVDKANREGG